jgi:hypothetical protein
VQRRCAVAVQDPHERCGFLALSFGGEQHRDVAVDDLRCGIAEETLGGAVPRCDTAVAIIADDRVACRIDVERRGGCGRHVLLGHSLRDQPPDD